MSRCIGLLFFLLILIVSCGHEQPQSNNQLEQGLWRGQLNIGDGESIPFHFNLSHDGESGTAEIMNGDETIKASLDFRSTDSVYIEMPVFNSAFFMKVTGPTKMTGIWQNFNKGKDYTIPFVAEHGKPNRFEPPKNPIMDPLGEFKWEVVFSPETDSSGPAIGLFDYQPDGVVHGTFATEKGDYRFLEGLYCDSTLRLSCFDGAHAFLFKAKKDPRGRLSGNFWSGHKWKEPWVAEENSGFTLTHPDSLTRLTIPSEDISFSFPDLKGDTVSLSDDKYKDKAVIIQVLGSWCPNCADESSLLSSIYNEHNQGGLEIIGLCFEATRDHAVAVKRVQKFKDNLGINYDLLVAGYASKKEATKTLGFLDNITSFPTSIYLDKNKKVQKIHTGFYGPGTGSYYAEHVKEINAFVAQLLAD